MAKTYIKSNYYWRDPFVTESWWEEGYSKSLAHLRRGVKKKKSCISKTTPFLLVAQKKQKSPLCWHDPWSFGGSRVCFIDCLLQHEEILEVTTIPNYNTSPPSSRFQGKKTFRSSIRTPIHHGIFLQCKEISAVQNISIPPFLLWTSSAELVVS